MIRVTGDTHGDIIRFIENNMEDSDWEKDDFLIICGDFMKISPQSSLTPKKNGTAVRSIISEIMFFILCEDKCF